MQSHGITLAFHREMADSSRELVGPDITDAATLERYPRFIKGGFQDYERLGVKSSTAESKHVPSLRSLHLTPERCRADLTWPTETRLHGWACRTPTQKCRRKLS